MGTGRPAPLPGTAPRHQDAIPGPVHGTRVSNSLAEEGMQAVCSHVYYVHLQNLKGNKLKKKIQLTKIWAAGSYPEDTTILR